MLMGTKLLLQSDGIDRYALLFGRLHYPPAMPSFYSTASVLPLSRPVKVIGGVAVAAAVVSCLACGITGLSPTVMVQVQA